MSELQCPLCGMPMDTDGVGAYCTGTHIFQCDVMDIPRISAAMEFAEARAWRKEVWEATRKPWPFAEELRKRGWSPSIESILYSLDFAEECVKKAEKRVDEVLV